MDWREILLIRVIPRINNDHVHNCMMIVLFLVALFSDKLNYCQLLSTIGCKPFVFRNEERNVLVMAGVGIRNWSEDFIKLCL